MRIAGTLAKWNDDRGFGFIAPSQGGQEIFVHVSAFPNDGQRPRLGEPLSFAIETDKDGKKRAKAVSRPVRADAARVQAREPRRPRQRRSLLGRVVPLVIMIALGTYGYGEYSRRVGSHAAAIEAEPARSARPSAGQDAAARFRCDGRTHCSQMASCAEATYFLRYCPGVEMDGNHDGVPCEQQWCANAFTE